MNTIKKGNNRVVLSPRISLNKLGEYMTASFTRRRTIIKEQKYPNPHRGVARYSAAREAIVRHLAASPTDNRLLDEALRNLGSHPFLKKWQNEHRTSCRLAIESFAKSFPPSSLHFGLEDMVIVGRRHNDSVSLNISGVKVSLRPDAVLRGGLGNQDVVGVVKLHFSKDHALKLESGQFISTLLHQYAEQFLSEPGVEASRDHCVVMDVRHSAFYTAPQCFKKRRSELAAACEEIAQRWDSI